VKDIPGLQELFKDAAGSVPKIPEPTLTPDQLYNACRAILQSLKVCYSYVFKVLCMRSSSIEGVNLGEYYIYSKFYFILKIDGICLCLYDYIW